MKFYQKRGFALVVLVLAILGSCVYGISKKPADLPQVTYGNWLRDDADLLTDETEASLRQYDQSWDSDYRAIIAVATLDTLNGWTYEKAAAELGSRWGLGGNDMLLLLVKDSDYYVALGDNVLDAMTDTYQAGLQGAVETPYYQGDYDAAALAFFRQADVFYAQTLGRQQSGGSYFDYEDNGAWQGNDSGSVAAVVLLVVGIFVVWILLDGLRYRRYRRRPMVVGGPVYYPVFWGRHPRPPRRPAPPRGPRPPMGGGPRPPMGAAPDRRWEAVLGPVDPGPVPLDPPGLPVPGPPGASAAGAAAAASAARASAGAPVPAEAAVAAASAGKASAEASDKLNKKIAAGTKFLPLFFQLGKNLLDFSPKRWQPAACIISAPSAQKFHTGRLRGIFSHAHVVRENDSIYSPSADGELCEAFSLWLGVL